MNLRAKEEDCQLSSRRQKKYRETEEGASDQLLDCGCFQAVKLLPGFTFSEFSRAKYSDFGRMLPIPRFVTEAEMRVVAVVVVAREKIIAIVTSMQTLCLRDILWNRLLWSEVADEHEGRHRRRTGDEGFRDPVS